MTALDRLGHGEMNNEVCNAFRQLFPKVPSVSFALAVINEHRASGPSATPLRAGIWTRYFTIENKKAAIAKYGLPGLFLYSLYRLYVGLLYYAKLYRVTETRDVLVDLEFEPLQSVVFHLFSRRVPFKHHLCVVHSFPNGREKGLRRLYKKLTLLILRMYVKRSAIIGVMTEDDLNMARSLGFAEDQIVLVGWGLRKHVRACESVARRENEPIRFLMAGVLRDDKQIQRVIQFFYQLGVPDFRLLIAGAPIDVSPDTLRASINELGMSASIEVNARYFTDREFNALFDESDVVVISHDSGFHSMSGPLLTALEKRKPILCFSSNYVSRLVRTCGAGVVLSADCTMDISELRNEIRALKDLQYNIPDDFLFSWSSIVRRSATRLGIASP